jgi:glycosyltransferase involved in cell wall biosynthesis
MRLLIATDAWTPQINGVVRTLGSLVAELERRGHVVEVLNPGDFPTVPLPTYQEIRLAWPWPASIRARIEAFVPDHVHIATEGPIGWATRHVCLQRGRAFTTSYHTRFPEYLLARAPIPLNLSYAALRSFHNAGRGIMVSTPSIEAELMQRGFERLMRWGRGVDLARFHPGAVLPDPSCGLPGDVLAGLPRPIFLTVGRLAPEKNLPAFLALDLPGTKLVVGDGPAMDELKQAFPKAVFLGPRSHDALPALYAHADAFVFPSLTDTFGLVLIEALACGLPVAAFPAPGPRDVIGDSGAGVLDADLKAAAMAALRLDRGRCRSHALGFTWERSADQFLANVAAAYTATPAALGRAA